MARTSGIAGSVMNNPAAHPPTKTTLSHRSPKCLATAAVMRREMADRLWFISSLVLTLVVSYLGGMAAYRFALWAGF
jgi:hypothetical protein